MRRNRRRRRRRRASRRARDLLEASWGVLEASWAVLGPSWVSWSALWASRGPLGPSWGFLGTEKVTRHYAGNPKDTAPSPRRFETRGSDPLKDSSGGRTEAQGMRQMT